MLFATDHVITDSNYIDECDFSLDGEKMGFGLVPRNYQSDPVGSTGAVSFESLNEELPLIDWKDMPDAIAQKVESKSQLSDIRNRALNGRPIPSLNQGREGYCWIYSGTSALTILRELSGQEYKRLSAHGPGAKMRNFRNQGGWGAEGVNWLIKNGCPSVDKWAERSLSREYDNQDTWEEAKLYRLGEVWAELDVPHYEATMLIQQALSALIGNCPMTLDFSWWRHSVCGLDAVDVNPSLRYDNPLRYGFRIWNSWSDSYGSNGTAVITGKQIYFSGATAPRSAILVAA